MNLCIISGRITRNVEMRYTKNNVGVVTFSLAVKRKSKEAEADFINCVAYSSTAEFINKYCGTKGFQMTIKGRINTGKYQDKDNKTVYTTNVIVEEVEPVWNKKEETTQQTFGATKPAAVDTSFYANQDDLPF